MSRFRKLTQTIWSRRYHIIFRYPNIGTALDGQTAIEVGNCIRAFLEQKRMLIGYDLKIGNTSRTERKRTEQNKLFAN